MYKATIKMQGRDGQTVTEHDIPAATIIRGLVTD